VKPETAAEIAQAVHVTAGRPARDSAAKDVAQPAVQIAAAPASVPEIDPAVPDLEPTLSQGERSAHTSTRLDAPSPQAPPQQAAQPLSRAAALQVADALPRPGQPTIDITLNPEELGRVRLSVSGSETGLVVSILADRPETMDLIRRHLDMLSDQYRAQGFDAVRFEFSEGKGHHREGSDHGGTARQTAAIQPEADAPPQPGNARSGLDLRM
jgi:flagellar hook-length control protein FliK